MAKKAPSREGMILTTVALSRELYKRLRQTGLDLDTTGAELIRQALTEFLDRHDKGVKKQKGGSR
jgi:hypothetical protein